MYLVHARLRATQQAVLPGDMGAWMWTHARACDKVEHIVVHPAARPYPVLGLYLLADRLEHAEARAADLCRRVLRARAELADWELVDARVPMTAPIYEALLAPHPPLD
ncbi:hypothetical protein ACFWVC_00740 [Streptomyces sp. NPDC058691]|uniref:hypothetical protein n=1 Tax=Streptomyces sp. NPDC058691 TaxID=3346601 RepID=UPI00365E576A